MCSIYPKFALRESVNYNYNSIPEADFYSEESYDKYCEIIKNKCFDKIFKLIKKEVVIPEQQYWRLLSCSKTVKILNEILAILQVFEFPLTITKHFIPSEVDGVERWEFIPPLYSEGSLGVISDVLKNEAIKLWNNTLTDDEDPTVKRNNQFNSERIKSFLARLEGDRKKYVYLLKLKHKFVHATENDYLRDLNNNLIPSWNDTFPPFLEKELSLYEKIVKDPSFKAEKDSINSLTTTQQVLATQYFLKFLGHKNIDKTVIARFIAVLRGGKNYKDIYDKVREPNLHFINEGEDARFIAGLFRQLRQKQIGQMIENDLDELNKRNL